MGNQEEGYSPVLRPGILSWQKRESKFFKGGSLVLRGQSRQVCLGSGPGHNYAKESSLEAAESAFPEYCP